MILSIENNQQTIKVLSSTPSQDQFGVLIPSPQVLANSQKWVHYTEYHSKFSCAGCKTIIAMWHYIELRPQAKQQYLPKFQTEQDWDKLATPWL